jgi:predicted DNA-binding protein
MKHRLEILLNDELHEWLDRLSKRPGESKTSIVAAALEAYMSRGAAVELSEAVNARIDKLSDEHGRFARDLSFLAESFGLYVRHQLSVTSPLPESEQAAALLKGQKRFAVFLDQVARRVDSGRSLAEDVLDALHALRAGNVSEAAE